MRVAFAISMPRRGYSEISVVCFRWDRRRTIAHALEHGELASAICHDCRQRGRMSLTIHEVGSGLQGTGLGSDASRPKAPFGAAVSAVKLAYASPVGRR